MDTVSLEDWKKIQIKTARVISVEKIQNRDRLYKLQVNVGESTPIQIVSGLVPFYTAEELTGKTIIIIANLQPATIAGEVSQGMLLATNVDNEHVSLLTTDKDAKPGLIIR